jgi:hypothetical protein
MCCPSCGQEAIATNAPRLRQHRISLQIRAGLNAAEVVVRGIGSDLAMDYPAPCRPPPSSGRMCCRLCCRPSPSRTATWT